MLDSSGQTQAEVEGPAILWEAHFSLGEANVGMTPVAGFPSLPKKIKQQNRRYERGEE